MKTYKTAVIGCGAISDIYLTNMINRFNHIKVVACSAVHMESAVKQAEKYGIDACTTEEILEREDVDIVVNLTPVPAHYEIIKAALQAGKHVYTEKAMTLTLEQAKEVCALADEKGLYLCSAPDTFLGQAVQTAKRAIEEGRIGEITSCVVYANRDLELLASLFSFLRMPGGGILNDYGVYHLTALVSLLGNVDKVAAFVQNPYPDKRNVAAEHPCFGQPFRYENESQVSAILHFANGITGTFHLNGDTTIVDQAGFYVYGTKGVIQLGSPNDFGGEVRFTPAGTDFSALKSEILDYGLPYEDNARGLGPALMAEAMEAGEKAATDKSMAFHVMEVMEAIMESARTERFVKVETGISADL